MSFGEVLVSAVILAISTQTSLHSWSRITATTQRQNALEQALLQADQQLLAARRLLRRSPAAGCALSPEHLDQQLAPLLPQTPGLQRSWQQDPLAGGLWLRVAVEAGTDQPRLQRRLLLTAAGLGLCSPAQA